MIESETDKELEAYELLEECIASEQSTRYFLAGYRFFYSIEDVWQAIQRLYSNYSDTKSVKQYIQRCLKLWFSLYCVQDFKNNRQLANQVFIFSSKFKDKKFTSHLKTSFIKQIATEDYPSISIPPKCEAFGQPITLYHTSSFTVDQVADMIDNLSLIFIRSLPLDFSFNSWITDIGGPFFDHITFHVASHILWGKDAKTRVREYQFLLKVAVKLRWRDNFEMSFAVYQGLIQSSVMKLKRTLKKVGTSSKKSLATLDYLFDPKGGYHNYISEVNNISTPYIPILSILSRQLINMQGPNLAKIAGKILFPVAESIKRPAQDLDIELQRIALQPAFSPDKLAELASIRENPIMPDMFKSSDSESDLFTSDRGSQSQTEMSPRQFGTPRDLDACHRPIPRLPLNESHLRKTISFSNISSQLSPTSSSSRSSSRSSSPSSPRPVSRSRIVRTMKIRNIKKQMEEDPKFWTCEKVGEWLREINLSDYELDFLRMEIDGTELLRLNKKGMIRLNIASEDRKKLLDEIEKIKKN